MESVKSRGDERGEGEADLVVNGVEPGEKTVSSSAAGSQSQKGENALG